LIPITIIHHAAVVLPEIIRTDPITLADGRVARSGSAGAWELDLRDHLIFPGLINAHDHLHLNNIPPLPHAAPFPNSYAWIDAFQPHFQRPAVAASVAVPEELRLWQGGLKSLLCGATTVAHHDPWRPTLDDPAFPVRTLRRFGWSHSLLLGRCEDADASTAHGQAPRYGPPVVASYAATPADWPWIVHLAEGTDAVAAAELAQLAALGCLARNTVLVHGVGLTDADVDRVIACGAGVVWCPSSNIGMLGRTLDPRPLFDAGRLALGSDSRLTGAPDMLDELRVAAHSDLTPAELLRLVTSDASRVLAMHEVGGLAAGQQADLLIVRAGGQDPYRTLLDLRRSDIRAVVRGGVPAIADPDFAEWFAVCDVPTARVTLNGCPKLIARTLLGPPGAAALEPGLLHV
jgi:cytosine/adenosine deaminase-related metal-dependent hydrolase